MFCGPLSSQIIILHTDVRSSQVCGSSGRPIHPKQTPSHFRQAVRYRRSHLAQRPCNPSDRLANRHRKYFRCQTWATRRVGQAFLTLVVGKILSVRSGCIHSLIAHCHQRCQATLRSRMAQAMSCFPPPGRCGGRAYYARPPSRRGINPDVNLPYLI